MASKWVSGGREERVVWWYVMFIEECREYFFRADSKAVMYSSLLQRM